MPNPSFDSRQVLKDYQDLCKDNQTVQIHRHVTLRNRRYEKLEVGDVLIKMGDDGKPVKKFRAGSKRDVNQKFIVVLKDECNIVFAKQIKADGTLGKIMCINSSSYTFALDPHYLDSKVLDVDYSPADEIVNARSFNKYGVHE